MKKTTFAGRWLAGILTALVLGLAQGPAARAASNLPDCHGVNLRTVSVGFKCSLDNWWVFERVERSGFGEAWKAPDGVIWSDRIRVASQVDGIDICAKLGATLPSKQDFQSCSTGGRRVVLPNFTGDYYWSTYNDWTNADAYDCRGGVTVANINNPVCCAVRCVAR